MRFNAQKIVTITYLSLNVDNWKRTAQSCRPELQNSVSSTANTFSKDLRYGQPYSDGQEWAADELAREADWVFHVTTLLPTKPFRKTGWEVDLFYVSYLIPFSMVLDENANTLFLTEMVRGTGLALKVFFDRGVTVW